MDVFVAIAFVAIPYLMNVVSSHSSVNVISQITRDDTINAYTKHWFSQNSKLFNFLVLISGGSFRTLKLLNSRLFGLSNGLLVQKSMHLKNQW